MCRHMAGMCRHMARMCRHTSEPQRAGRDPRLDNVRLLFIQVFWNTCVVLHVTSWGSAYARVWKEHGIKYDSFRFPKPLSWRKELRKAGAL